MARSGGGFPVRDPPREGEGQGTRWASDGASPRVCACRHLKTRDAAVRGGRSAFWPRAVQCVGARRGRGRWRFWLPKADADSESGSRGPLQGPRYGGRAGYFWRSRCCVRLRCLRQKQHRSQNPAPRAEWKVSRTFCRIFRLFCGLCSALAAGSGAVLRLGPWAATPPVDY